MSKLLRTQEIPVIFIILIFVKLVEKICQICFMKMRQFWIINVSRLRTFKKRFLTWTQEKSKFVLSLSSFLALKNNIDTPGIGYKNVE